MNLSPATFFSIAVVAAASSVAAQDLGLQDLRRDLLARTTVDQALRHGRVGTLAFTAIARDRANELGRLPLTEQRRRIDAMSRDYRAIVDRVDRAAARAFAETERGVEFRAEQGMANLRARVLESLDKNALPGDAGAFVRELNTLLAAGRIRLDRAGSDALAAVAEKSDGLDLLRSRGVRAIRGVIDSALDDGLDGVARQILEPLASGLDLADSISEILGKGRRFAGVNELGQLFAGDPTDGDLQKRIARFAADKVGGALRAAGKDAFDVALHDASEAVDLVARFLGVANKKLAADVRRFGSAALQIAESIQSFRLDKIGASVLTGDILGGVLKLFGSVFSSGPSFEDIVLEQLTEIRKQIDQVRTEMHQRFGRIERRLDRIHHLLNTRFDDLLRGQDLVLRDLRAMHAEVVGQLRRIEARVDGLLEWDVMRDYYTARNRALGRSDPGKLGFEDARAAFLTLAVEGARALCPAKGGIADDRMAAELDKRWGENLNYLAAIARGYSNSRFGATSSIDPLAWSIGVDAYLDLVRRWPGHITPEQVRDDIENKLLPQGVQLADAIRAITVDVDGSPQRRFFKRLVREYGSRAVALQDAIHVYAAQFARDHGLAGGSGGARYGLRLWHEFAVHAIAEQCTLETGQVVELPEEVKRAGDSPVAGPDLLAYPESWQPLSPITQWLAKLEPGSGSRLSWQFRVEVTPADVGIADRRVLIIYECLFDGQPLSRRQYQSPPMKIWHTAQAPFRMVTSHPNLHGPVPGKPVHQHFAEWFKPNEFAEGATWDVDGSKVVVGGYEDFDRVVQLAAQRLRPLVDAKRRVFLREVGRVLSHVDADHQGHDRELAVAARKLESSRVLLTTFLRLGLSESVQDDERLRACLGGPDGGVLAGVPTVLRALDEYRRTFADRWERQLPRPLSRALRDAREFERAIVAALESSADRGGEPHWFIEETLGRLRFFEALIERGAVDAPE